MDTLDFSKLSSTQVHNLKNELTCSICFDFFRLPVTINCGHTFCRYCVSSHGHSVSGKCPLCRTTMTGHQQVNITIQSLLNILNLHPANMQATLVAVPETDIYWKKSFNKPTTALPVFFKAILQSAGSRVPPSLIQDLILISYELLNYSDAWARGPWVVDSTDARTLMTEIPAIIPFIRHLCGQAIADPSTQQRLEAPLEDDYKPLNPIVLSEAAASLESWTNDYASKHPSALRIFGNCTSRLAAASSPNNRGGTLRGGLNRGPLFTVHVLEDALNRVTAQYFDTSTLQSVALPWVLGRHKLAGVNISHPSVSMSHCIFVPLTEDDEVSRDSLSFGSENDLHLGVMDCNSSIGTMVLMEPKCERSLKDGDIIHIHDYREVEIRFLPPSAENPFRNLFWSKSECRIRYVSDSEISSMNLLENNNNEIIFSNNNTAANDDHAESDVSGSRLPSRRPSMSHNVMQHDAVSSPAASPPFDLEPIDTFLEMWILTPGGRDESSDDYCREKVFVNPAGTVCGRGELPASRLHAQFLDGLTPDKSRFVVTTAIEWVSRDHFEIYYDGSRPRGERWVVRTNTEKGTFLRLQPFAPPEPIFIGSIIKVGQCEIFVGGPDDWRPMPRVQRGRISNNNNNNQVDPLLVHPREIAAVQHISNGNNIQLNNDLQSNSRRSNFNRIFVVDSNSNNQAPPAVSSISSLRDRPFGQRISSNPPREPFVPSVPPAPHPPRQRLSNNNNNNNSNNNNGNLVYNNRSDILSRSAVSSEQQSHASSSQQQHQVMDGRMMLGR